MDIPSLMPGVLEDLKRLVGHASVAFPGFPPEPVHAMKDDVLQLFRAAGVADARALDIGGTYPAVYGEIPAPPGKPTIMLYAHYDVQPAPPEQGWTTDPWTATVGEDGRIYGRGAADDKSGVVTHLGTLRAFEGRPPVGVRILIEGEEETASPLNSFIQAHPELFVADAYLICDGGNVRCGEPVITTTLRGGCICQFSLSTLTSPVHSGLFGGAAPDALLAMIRLLSTLHTPDGDVAIEGLHGFDWPGAGFPEDDFRAAAGVLDGVDLTGTGSIASRLWSRPSLTVLGLDAPATAASVAALVPKATAKISMRVPPGGDPQHHLDLLLAHLRKHTPGNAQLEIIRTATSPPFSVDPSDATIAAARAAMSEAFGQPAAEIGCGGSIPLCDALQSVAPHASLIMWGAEDTAKARIHAPQESVDPDEIRRLITAQVRFIEQLDRAAEGVALPPVA
ncbi:MAG TPA: M20/M25/M40 family metallo-hydrolase [Candidatus Limnocylindrales bacterium]|nr:M20/M25/M40 family metallo-hydrolase [Candidatus Limnocylindrales bacterium]